MVDFICDGRTPSWVPMPWRFVMAEVEAVVVAESPSAIFLKAAMFSDTGAPRFRNPTSRRLMACSASAASITEDLRKSVK